MKGGGRGEGARRVWLGCSRLNVKKEIRNSDILTTTNINKYVKVVIKIEEMEILGFNLRTGWGY